MGFNIDLWENVWFIHVLLWVEEPSILDGDKMVFVWCCFAWKLRETCPSFGFGKQLSSANAARVKLSWDCHSQGELLPLCWDIWLQLRLHPINSNDLVEVFELTKDAGGLTWLQWLRSKNISLSRGMRSKSVECHSSLYKSPWDLRLLNLFWSWTQNSQRKHIKDHPCFFPSSS